MILLIISIIVSIVPTILIVILLKKRKDDVQYKKLCNGATIRGAIGGFPVIAMSGALYFLLFMLLSFGLVLVDIVLVVLMIVFFAKVSKKPKYNEILNA